MEVVGGYIFRKRLLSMHRQKKVSHQGDYQAVEIDVNMGLGILKIWKYVLLQGVDDWKGKAYGLPAAVGNLVE